MNERAILKGHLADLKMRKMELDTGISANIKAVKSFLAGAAITPLDKIDLESALVNLTEAVRMKKDRAEVIAKIAAVDEELA